MEALHPVGAIQLIHKMDGYAIWAHPFITPDSLREKYFKLFIKYGIDAIEASYAYRENGYKGDETNRKLKKWGGANLISGTFPLLEVLIARCGLIQ